MQRDPGHMGFAVAILCLFLWVLGLAYNREAWINAFLGLGILAFALTLQRQRR